mmetsp:Transcript_85846/g.262681  ORF Transcript_85846/g.262681 Transcript_85846/m.262681 type:complete len:230 (-) Transcript_85846:245-934(-)
MALTRCGLQLADQASRIWAPSWRRAGITRNIRHNASGEGATKTLSPTPATESSPSKLATPWRLPSLTWAHAQSFRAHSSNPQVTPKRINPPMTKLAQASAAAPSTCSSSSSKHITNVVSDRKKSAPTCINAVHMLMATSAPSSLLDAQNACKDTTSKMTPPMPHTRHMYGFTVRCCACLQPSPRTKRIGSCVVWMVRYARESSDMPPMHISSGMCIREPLCISTKMLPT